MDFPKENARRNTQVGFVVATKHLPTVFLMIAKPYYFAHFK